MYLLTSHVRTIFVLRALLLLPFLAIVPALHGQIKVSPNHRYLTTADGQPFFWLGDTDWEMAHRLTRENIATFIGTRKQQGFNVLQVVALAEFNGIRQPNRYGDYPLNNEDPTQLLVTPGSDPKDPYQYDYWDHLDYLVNLAGENGMYIGLLPTWGDKIAQLWGDGPRIFNAQNAEVYGRLLAERYKDKWNVLWILGGDRPAVYEKDKQQIDDRPVYRAMAKGIETVLGPEAFITYHPAGGDHSTSQYIQAEPWLDMNAFQSGHGARETEAWNWVKRDLALKPEKPTLDMEPCYEDHPVNPWDGKWTRARGYFTAYDVRARIYRGVFAGACGVTYGHHQIWQFLDTTLNPAVNPGDTLIGWQKASNAEAANEMQYLKNLMLSRPYFTRVGDQSIITSDAGKDYRDLVVATIDAERSYAMVYFPKGRTAKINLGRISGPRKTIWWYDVRSGEAKSSGTASGSTRTFTPPDKSTDWVLVIDDASKGFAAPGALNR
jgi:hypothetical protein